MKPALPARLLQTLAPWRNAPAWHIAFSGGLDSTVLLHLLATLAKSETLPLLNAIHVHHGLQAVADAWPIHCQSVCDSLGVPLRVMRVQVQSGASLERAAREARYQAFTKVTGVGEVVLTGQHRDDQAETLLFRLLRGAGVRGLAAMPAHHHWRRGRLHGSRQDADGMAGRGMTMIYKHVALIGLGLIASSIAHASGGPTRMCGLPALPDRQRPATSPGRLTCVKFMTTWPMRFAMPIWS